MKNTEKAASAIPARKKRVLSPGRGSGSAPGNELNSGLRVILGCRKIPEFRALLEEAARADCAMETACILVIGCGTGSSLATTLRDTLRSAMQAGSFVMKREITS